MKRKQATAPEIPALPSNFDEPKGLDVKNIRKREDGSFVVSIRMSEELVVPDYHVVEGDRYMPVGLWDAVKDAIAAGAEVSDWEHPAAPPFDEVFVLSEEKSEADRVIGLIQMAFDVGDKSVKESLLEWKRYRLALERNGLQPDIPQKPDWIS